MDLLAFVFKNKIIEPKLNAHQNFLSKPSSPDDKGKLFARAFIIVFLMQILVKHKL